MHWPKIHSQNALAFILTFKLKWFKIIIFTMLLIIFNIDKSWHPYYRYITPNVFSDLFLHLKSQIRQWHSHGKGSPGLDIRVYCKSRNRLPEEAELSSNNSSTHRFQRLHLGQWYPHPDALYRNWSPACNQCRNPVYDVDIGCDESNDLRFGTEKHAANQSRCSR